MAGGFARLQKVDPMESESELHSCQVTVGSVLGAMAYHTGGVLVDLGWLKILGARSNGCPWSISRLTENLGWSRGEDPPSAVAVGLDILGGVFAINGGGIASESLGNVFYFDPSCLRWEDLRVPHSQWLASMLEPPRVAKFYADMRWAGCENEAKTLRPEQGISVAPPLFTAESRPLERASRRPVPLDELVRLNFDMARQVSR